MDRKDVTKHRGLHVPLKEYCFECRLGTYVNAICG